MARQIRSDSTIGSVEKRIGKTGVIRNRDGRKTRKDKRVSTVRAGK